MNNESYYHREGPSSKDVIKDVIKSLKLNPGCRYLFKCHDIPSVDGEGIVRGSWHRVFKHYNCIHPAGCYNELSKICIDNEEFMNIVKLYINDEDVSSYGSWRGYFTFKYDIINNMKKKILNDMDILYDRKKAYHILKEKFTPYVFHWLYKPYGPRMRETMKNTQVGKQPMSNHDGIVEYYDDEGKWEDDPRNGKYYVYCG